MTPTGDSTVLSVALFGTATLWAFDRTFAAAARVPNEPFTIGGHVGYTMGGDYGSGDIGSLGDVGGR